MPDPAPEPAKLDYNEENVYKVTAEFLQKVSDGDEEMAKILQDPQKAKELLATRINKPANWDQIVYVFQKKEGPNDRFTVGALPRLKEAVDLDVMLMCSWRTPH